MNNENHSPGHFNLTVSEDDSDVAYLRLPTHPGGTCPMSKSLRLVDIIGAYDGPDIVLDFDDNDTLVGLEILA